MIGRIRRSLRNLGWWALDYAYAVVWQVRGIVGPTDPSDFSSGDGRPVLIIPGIWESWSFLRPLITPVHAAGHPVHVVSALRRNGRPVVATAHDVAAYLREHELHDVVIVAHSKGGLIGKYTMTLLDPDGRVASMVAVNSPFSGSRYAPYLVLSSLRAFSPRDPTTVLLGRSLEINSRITSIYSEFDPHIPGGSELAGATNVRIATGGHFRILADPRTIAEVLRMVG